MSSDGGSSGGSAAAHSFIILSSYIYSGTLFVALENEKNVFFDRLCSNSNKEEKCVIYKP